MQIALIYIAILSEDESKNLAQNYQYNQKALFSSFVTENKEFVLLDFDNYSESWIISSIQDLLNQFIGVVVVIQNKEKAKIQPIISFLGHLLRHHKETMFIINNHNTLISKVLSKFPNDNIYQDLEVNQQKEILFHLKSIFLDDRDSQI